MQPRISLHHSPRNRGTLRQKATLLPVQYTSAGASENKSVVRIPLIPERVFVGHVAPNKNCVVLSPNLCSSGNGFRQICRINILNAGEHIGDGRVRTFRKLWKHANERMRPHSDTDPMPNLICRSLPKILYFYHPLRLQRILENKYDLRNADLRPEFPDLGCLHLGNNSFGLCPSLGHPLFLLFRNVGLFRGYFQSFPKQDDLQEPVNASRKVKNHVTQSAQSRRLFIGSLLISTGLLAF